MFNLKEYFGKLFLLYQLNFPKSDNSENENKIEFWILLFICFFNANTT